MSRNSEALLSAKNDHRMKCHSGPILAEIMFSKGPDLKFYIDEPHRQFFSQILTCRLKYLKPFELEMISYSLGLRIKLFTVAIKIQDKKF